MLDRLSVCLFPARTLRLSGSSVRPAYPGFMVMKTAHEALSASSTPSNMNRSTYSRRDQWFRDCSIRLSYRMDTLQPCSERALNITTMTYAFMRFKKFEDMRIKKFHTISHCNFYFYLLHMQVKHLFKT